MVKTPYKTYYLKSFSLNNIYKMCCLLAFVYNYYMELKEKEILNRVNLRKLEYYIIDAYGDFIVLK